MRTILPTAGASREIIIECGSVDCLHMITVLIPLYILYTVLIYTVSIQEINIFNHFILIGHITIHLLSETSCCRQLKLKEKCFSVISHFLGGGGLQHLFGAVLPPAIHSAVFQRSGRWRSVSQQHCLVVVHHFYFIPHLNSNCVCCWPVIVHFFSVWMYLFSYTADHLYDV